MHHHLFTPRTVTTTLSGTVTTTFSRTVTTGLLAWVSSPLSSASTAPCPSTWTTRCRRRSWTWPGSTTPCGRCRWGRWSSSCWTTTPPCSPPRSDACAGRCRRLRCWRPCCRGNSSSHRRLRGNRWREGGNGLWRHPQWTCRTPRKPCSLPSPTGRRAGCTASVSSSGEWGRCRTRTRRKGCRSRGGTRASGGWSWGGRRCDAVWACSRSCLPSRSRPRSSAVLRSVWCSTRRSFGNQSGIVRDSLR